MLINFLINFLIARFDPNSIKQEEENVKVEKNKPKEEVKNQPTEEGDEDGGKKSILPYSSMFIFGTENM